MMKRILPIATIAMMATSLGYVAAQAKHNPKQGFKSGSQVKKVSLTDPTKFKDVAPATFKVKFVTTQGEFVISATRASSPLGADRFYNMAKSGYLNGIKFFRVVPGFVVQFGIHGDPAVAPAWLKANINDEPVKMGNTKGTLTFAKAGANSRSCQMFINLGDNSRLDGMGFSAFGTVTTGMNVVEKLYSGYGDSTTDRQGEIAEGGNKYLNENFPKLDSIKTATIMK